MELYQTCNLKKYWKMEIKTLEKSEKFVNQEKVETMNLANVEINCTL